MENELLSNRSRERGNYKSMRMNGTTRQQQPVLPSNLTDTPSPQKENSNLMMYLAVGGGLLTLGTIGYLVYKNRKLNQDNEQMASYLEEIKLTNNQRTAMNRPPQSRPQNNPSMANVPTSAPAPKVQFIPVPSMEHGLSQTSKMYTDIYNEMEDMELDEIEADQRSLGNDDADEVDEND